MQNKYTHKVINNRNYNVVEIQNFMHNINININTATNTIAGNVLASNTQTVHLSSINKAITSSFNNIVKYIEKNKIKEQKDVVKDIISSFKKHKLNNINECNHFLMIKCTDRTKHSIVHLSYVEVLSMIWSIIVSHQQRSNLVERLNTELVDSIGMCFTGCINRLVNVLVGYIEGVVVSISLKEEIQMSIQRLMDNLNKKIITYKQTKEEMIQILDQPYDVDTNDTNNIISNEYKEAWLLALQDYRPDAVLCKFDDKVFENEQNTNAFYYISYDNLIYNSEQRFEEETEPIGIVNDEKQQIANIYEYKIGDDLFPEKLLNYKLV